jgi:hypothetical protein
MMNSSAVLRRVGAALLLSALLAAGASTADAATFTPLTLQNGWTNGPFGNRNAGVSLVSGIVEFDGVIASGSPNVPAFTLPVGLRPATNVYVPVDLCNATKGRLLIQPSGSVTVQSEGAFSNAQCLTSLEGASFAPSASGFVTLALQNGWTSAPFGTSAAAVQLINGIVHFKGAIANGASAVAFTLPAGFAPATMVYLPVDMCNATSGRLMISPSGTVSVQAESAFASAQCFTSLDGASFALSASGFTGLPLTPPWTSAPFATSNAAAEDIDGIVHLKGAIASGSGQAFTLPSGMRPEATVRVPVDLCNATGGRLVISSSGAVSVEAENGAVSNETCFTSLDGVSFAAANFTPLALQNGWTRGPLIEAAPASAIVEGIVYFKGAFGFGTSAVAFTLPAGQRPATDVYIPVNLGNTNNGRLFIAGGTGVVSVQAEGGGFQNAVDFTSLEGASFAPSATGFTPLALQNGWTNAPFSTSNAAVGNIGGVVHFKGAIASGNGSPFTLPAAFVPAQSVYVAVDLCNATKGRLFIAGGSGIVTVQAANGTVTNTQCFTSLDGASFVLDQGGSTALVPINGWFGAPFGTRGVALIDLAGIVHLSGAIATATRGAPFTLPFTLPPALIPADNAFIPIDLCNATKGTLVIAGGTGEVQIAAENDTTNAQCFTSLEGAFYSL